MGNIMNIAFAKLGKSIKFSSAYSPTGGDNEAPAFLESLAKNNPDITFYIAGRSDFKKLSDFEKSVKFPYNNVIDCWDGISKNRNDAPYHLLSYFKDIKIDHSIIMFGQVAAVTVPGKTKQIKDKTLDAAVVDMTRSYTSPLTIWLNESKTPYIEIQNDPRYHSGQPRDLLHHPHKTLSQYNYTYFSSKIISWENQNIEILKFPVTYNGMEVGYCYMKEYPDLLSLKNNKDIHMTVVLNEGKPSRFNMLNEWILNYNKDIHVYGSWEHKKTINDNRFKGSKSLSELEDILKRTKYSFIIPIAKGWVTSKYIEMIHNGVIPFFHPTYDEQLHIKVPDILRPKSPEELYKSINLIDSDENLYNDILSELQNVLNPEYYNGKFLSKTILSEIIPNYELPDLSKFNKIESNTYSILDFMK
jgi:hypothetical protein